MATVWGRWRARRRVRQQAKHFTHWQRDNPGKKFRDYYVESVSHKLDDGRSHPTLGGSLTDSHVAESGRPVLEYLAGVGLEPEHVCVDYGCGSLRVGRHLMAYVEPGHYWGLDITSRFIDEGVALLGPELTARHRPNLRVINEASLLEVRKARPDFLVSTGVLFHVPPTDLDDYLEQVMACVDDGTRAFLDVPTSERPTQYSAVSWSYTKESLEAAVRRLGARCSFDSVRTFERPELGLVLDHCWLEITR